MQKILGLTLVLAVCMAGAALACDGAHNAKGAKLSAASASGTCPYASAEAKSASGTCAMGAKNASAGECSNMKNASAMKHASAKAGGACCMDGMKNASAEKCNMDAATCAKMEHSSFTVAGLKNKATAAKIRAALASMDNVQMVHCDATTGTAVVCWKGAKNVEAVSRKLNDAGYKTAVLKAEADCPSSAACPHPCKKGDKVSKES